MAHNFHLGILGKKHYILSIEITKYIQLQKKSKFPSRAWSEGGEARGSVITSEWRPPPTRAWSEGGGVSPVGVERNPLRLAFGAREGRREREAREGKRCRVGIETPSDSHLERGRGGI